MREVWLSAPSLWLKKKWTLTFYAPGSPIGAPWSCLGTPQVSPSSLFSKRNSRLKYATEKENHLKNTLILSSCSMRGPSHPRNPPLPPVWKQEFIFTLINRKMPKRFFKQNFLNNFNTTLYTFPNFHLNNSFNVLCLFIISKYRLMQSISPNSQTLPPTHNLS